MAEPLYVRRLTTVAVIETQISPEQKASHRLRYYAEPRAMRRRDKPAPTLTVLVVETDEYCLTLDVFRTQLRSLVSIGTVFY